jgi:hypothetical protein
VKLKSIERAVELKKRGYIVLPAPGNQPFRRPSGAKEAAEVTGIPYVMEADMEEAGRILVE